MTEEEYIKNRTEINEHIRLIIINLITLEYQRGFDAGIEFMQRKYPELLNKA